MVSRKNSFRPSQTKRKGRILRLRLARHRFRRRGVGVRLRSRIRQHEESYPFDKAPTDPVIEDIEQLFWEFLKPQGARRGSDFFQQSSSKKNADFVLPNEKLILEIKELEVPLNYSKEGAERVVAVLKKLDVPIEEMLPFLMSVGPIPLDVGAEFFRIVRQNLRSDIRKGYRQLQATWHALGDSSYRSVLVLANSGVSMLPEVSIRAMILGEMNSGSYWSKGVEAVVFYSGNVSNILDFSSRVYKTWVPLFANDDINRSFGGILDRLGTDFLIFKSKRAGETNQYPIFLENIEEIQALARRSKGVRPK